MSRPKKPVIVYSACGSRRSEVAFALRTRVSAIWVASCADGVGLLQSFCYADTACLVLLRDRDPHLDRVALAVIQMLSQKLPEMRVIDVRAFELEVEDSPAATQVLCGADIGSIVQAVRIACLRKRGPKGARRVRREEVVAADRARR